jgi:hypothetical protein
VLFGFSSASGPTLAGIVLTRVRATRLHSYYSDDRVTTAISEYSGRIYYSDIPSSFAKRTSDEPAGVREEAMATRLTIDQLEKMKTHELADMLANVLLLLRRMPDVECKQLVQQVPNKQNIEQPAFEQVSLSESSFTREELSKQTVPELKALAKKLNVLLPSSIKKDSLIDKILTRPVDGRSEQWAIQDIS